MKEDPLEALWVISMIIVRDMGDGMSAEEAIAEIVKVAYPFTGITA